ncbi:MAG: hypothetical protein J4F36_12180 [Nitrosopumilaceae archaeon]|nr:hypothetical protein [Nitrosopumilaceae archaeon]
MTQEVEKRWNDCWHDEKRKVYVTHNKYFKGIPNAHTREIQIQYEKENNDDGIVIEENRIKFFFGYPAIKLDYDDGASVNFLLPTLTDDMITKEIVKCRLIPKSKEETIVYTTESENWLEFGDGLKLTDKEYELGMDLGRYSPIPLSALKAASNRN